jgi:hypothetical protein
MASDTSRVGYGRKETAISRSRLSLITVRFA